MRVPLAAGVGCGPEGEDDAESPPLLSVEGGGMAMAMDMPALAPLLLLLLSLEGGLRFEGASGGG